jgi:periplasmic copper chaperone A
LLFKIADGKAIHQNAHVFAELPLVIQHIGFKPWVGSEDNVQDRAHIRAISCKRRTVDMPAQIRREVNHHHATTLAQEDAFRKWAHLPKACAMHRRSILLLPFAATAAHAHSYAAGKIKIGHAWALPQHVGQDGQCFMPLYNEGDEADALVAARSDLTSFIELRENARYDHPPAQQFDLLPGKPLAMRPQAVHLRLAGLSRDLKLRDRFKLVLDFLNAGELEVEVYVESTPGD